MSHLCLIRGISGSGKSTLAKSMLDAGMFHYHYENDQWRMVKGEYIYDPRMTKYTVRECQRATYKALMSGKNVVVANTFIRQWEMREYFTMPFTKLTVIVCQGDFDNVHNVPKDRVQWMKDNFEW